MLRGEKMGEIEIFGWNCKFKTISDGYCSGFTFQVSSFLQNYAITEVAGLWPPCHSFLPYITVRFQAPSPISNMKSSSFNLRIMQMVFSGEFLISYWSSSSGRQCATKGKIEDSGWRSDVLKWKAWKSIWIHASQGPWFQSVQRKTKTS